MPPSVRLLFNPASGRGRGARQFPALRAAFAAQGFTDIRATERAGDEARLISEALHDGIETIVVAGGDGTWGKCAVALAQAGSPARMAFLAAGTGNDFAKNLRVDPRDPATLARLLREEVHERRIDLGRVDDHWFLNVAGFGFDAAVLEATARYPRLRGNAVYIAAALGELLGYPGFELRGGDAPRQSTQRLMLLLSNGAWFGGAFHIAPEARVDDGLLDLISIAAVAPIARPLLFARALRGAALRHPGVSSETVAARTLTFATAPAFEIDGELRWARDTQVTVAALPGVLRVVDLPP